MKLEERLRTLNKLNANTKFVNKQLYRLLYSPDFYKLAYEKLKTNKGAMTSGISPNSNIDGMSMRVIDNIIAQLKDESYTPKPARRTYISKANGKLRPLGIPTFEDKLVQECIRVILTCIYDGNVYPTFSEYSYGFRSGLGTHHALRYVKKSFNGCCWIIKADIKAFFDEVDNNLLVSFLEKRIGDNRFIRLIRKFLKSGHIEKGQLFKPKKGTPQGGNLSPILSNIYLHEFDVFIEDLIKSDGTHTTYNKAYHRENRRLSTLKKAAHKSDKSSKKGVIDKWTKVAQQHSIVKNIPSRILADPKKAVIRYCRYADDWVIGLKCDKAKAKAIFEKCKVFFGEKLHLKWNEDKSILQRSIDQRVEFLGVYLSFVTPRQERYAYVKRGNTKYYRKTVSRNYVKLMMDDKDVLKKLHAKGYVNKQFFPVANRRLSNYEDRDIAKTYKATITGIANNYGFVHNIQALNKIHYFMFLSLAKTLAFKYNSSKAKMIKKYGGKVMRFEGKGKTPTIEIAAYGGYIRDTNNFQISVLPREPVPIVKYVKDWTKTWLNLEWCCICNKLGPTEMHHAKHVRKIGEKYTDFTKVMTIMNRRQIPVCLDCHNKIHLGLYDGAPLQELANRMMQQLGIRKWEDRRDSPPESALIDDKEIS